jgi:membrane-associated phospholipid phosphatase
VEEFFALIFFIPIGIAIFKESLEKGFFQTGWGSLVFIFTVIWFFYEVPKNSQTSFSRTVLPAFLCLTIYSNSFKLIQLFNIPDADRLLLKIDQVLFKTQPSLWLERINSSGLTDYLTVTYFLYYFYPVILGLIFYFKTEWQILRKYAVTIVTCFYIGYLGYILIPAIGPRLYLPQQYKQELKSSQFSLELRQFLDKIQPTKRDCFPSLHNAITLLVLIFAFKYQRKFFWGFLPFALGLFVGTIYLRYHYGVDLVFGWLLGLICFWKSADLNKWWEAKTSGL